MKFLSLILAALAGLLLSGCGSYLRKDPSQASIEAGFPTAELSGCGKRKLGLLFCGAERGSALESLGLTVHGLYKGTVRVVSTECRVDETYRYEGTKDIQLPITGQADKDCVYSVTINAEFPGEEDSGISINGARGHVAVRVTEAGERWFGQEAKVIQGTGGELPVELFGISGQFELQTAGCKKRAKYPVEVADGLSLNLGDLNDSSEVGTCIVEGVLRGPKTTYFNLLIANYAKDFVPLAAPTVSLKGKKLRVAGDTVVSVIEVNGEAKKGSTATFTVEDGPLLVRLYTVKGRIVLGKYSEGVWIWEN